MLSVRNLTKTPLPIRRAFLYNMKNEILGKEYELSLVFAGDALTRKLNLKWRKKNMPANTLSFSLSKNSGEIFLNAKQAKIDVSLPHLFIHSLLHLKGMHHGSTMNNAEEQYLKKFQV